jgi:hypothetical protein
MLWGTTTDAITTEMADVYRAIYKDPETRAAVCNARVAAYGTLTDSYGQEHAEELRVTIIPGDTADKVNWSETASVDWPKVWTTEYTAPEVQAEENKNAMEQAIDCATDSGFGDLDWLQCS